MSKEEKQITLTEAQAQYDKASKEYEALVKKTLPPKDAARAAEHQAACRKALCEKRYWYAVKDAIRGRRAVPVREDLVECRQ
jgi:hypothetical protein